MDKSPILDRDLEYKLIPEMFNEIKEWLQQQPHAMTDEEEKIVEIMKRLNLDKDPELALNREVDMMHGNLSDGQMQKISIVRSVLDDKEIMVFDEPEMHLDRDTKKNVMDYLNSIKKDRIIVLISHDGYVAENSDVVIALK